MKIQITGKTLPKYQWDFGSVGTQLDLSKIGIPNLENIATVPFGINDKRDQYGNTITKDSQGKEITYDATGNPTSYKTHKNPISTDQTKTQKNPFRYDYSAAQKMLTGMNFFNGMLQEGQGALDLQYNKKLGMTDAIVGAVPNKSSRGNLLMNVGTPGNLTTPVQFGGRPTSEFVGYPRYEPQGIFRAQEGLTIPGPIVPDRPDTFSDMPEVDVPRASEPPPAPETVAPAKTEAVEAESAFMIPVKNFTITSGFGIRKAPKGPKGPASTNHNGLDLAVPENSDVFAPMDGIVKSIYYNDQGGNQLIVQHPDGSRSGYAHLNGYKVKVGDQIGRGQVIALSGNTGNSNGAHLHFTFRNPEGDFVNPVDYFNLGVRYNKNTKINPEELTVVPGEQMDADLVLNTLASTERGRTGHGTSLTGPQGQKASALGIWGLTKGTRDGLYNKYFKNKMTKSDFDTQFTNDPSFERVVAKSLVNEFLPKYGSLVFGAWYYPQYAEQYLDGNTSVLNKVPRADYGNAITWGGYVKKAQDRYFKMTAPKQQPSQMPTFAEGGEYELDDDQIKQILAEGGEIEYL